MATRISNAAAIAAVNAVVDLLDAGVANGPGGAGEAYIEIRTGSQPADVSVAATGTLLGTLICSATAFGSAVDVTGAARATANAVASDNNADAAGTAGWFRAYDSDGNGIIDGNITITSGGGDMELDNINIAVNDTITVNSWTVTQPET